MRRVSARVVSVVCVLALGAGLAAPFTTAFDGLSGELEARLAGPLSGGDLGKTEKKQAKAASKVLRQLGKAADDLADDLKSLKVVEKQLRKPFKDEIPDGPLGGLLTDAADDLLAALNARRDALADAQSGLTGGDLEKVQKALSAYDRSSSKASPPQPVKKRAGAMLKLYSALRSGERVAGNGGGGGNPAKNTISALVDGVRVETSDTTPILDRADGTVLLAIVQALGTGESYQVQLAVKDVNGPGTYALDEENEYAIVNRFGGSAPGVFQLVPGTGSVTVTEFDLLASRVAATFSFDAKSILDDTVVQVRQGVADFDRVFATGQGPNPCEEGAATIDGAAFSPTLIVGTQVLSVLQISLAEPQRSMVVGIVDFVGTGTYTLFSPTSYYDVDANRNYLLTSGTLTITVYDPVAGRLEGTFTFDAAEQAPGTGTIQVRSGSFCLGDLSVGN